MTTETATTWTDGLRRLRACSDALAWAARYDSLVDAWADCHRGDWMLWLLGRLSGEPESEARKALVVCACACARTALRFTTDPRVLACIETSGRWARGEATIAEVRTARAAAYAAYAAAAAAAAAAAYAAYAKALAECAAIVRVHYPVAPVLA